MLRYVMLHRVMLFCGVMRQLVVHQRTKEGPGLQGMCSQWKSCVVKRSQKGIASTRDSVISLVA